MAVVSTTTYQYVDSNLTPYFIQGSALTDRGAWSSSAFYNVREVAQIGIDQYVALTPNSNSPPTGIVDSNWSSLVIVEENSGTVATNGSDAYARALAEQALQVAYAGTALGSAAYSYAQTAYMMAQTGTYLIALETGSRVWSDGTLQTQIITEQGTRSQADQYLQNQIITEQGTRSQADQYLQNQITAEINSRIAADQQIITIAVAGTNTANSAYALAQQATAALSVSFAGTVNLYTSYVKFGKPDTALTIVNGIVASRVESPIVWDDFDYYGTTSGTTPVTGMNLGTSWSGNGSIFTSNLAVGVVGTEAMNAYPLGTISSSTLNLGIGWATTGTSWGDSYWFRFLGTDTFEEYSTGTYVGGISLNKGGGWVGSAQCYTGSNRGIPLP